MAYKRKQERTSVDRDAPEITSGTAEIVKVPSAPLEDNVSKRSTLVEGPDESFLTLFYEISRTPHFWIALAFMGLLVLSQYALDLSYSEPQVVTGTEQNRFLSDCDKRVAMSFRSGTNFIAPNNTSEYVVMRWTTDNMPVIRARIDSAGYRHLKDHADYEQQFSYGNQVVFLRFVKEKI